MNRIPLTRREWIDRVAEVYGRGRPLAVLFDYDGTLTPIVRHPSLARLVPRTREQLRRLTALPGVRVGVISGRSLSEVRTLVGINGVYYVGSGGLEIDLVGTQKRYPDTDSVGTLLDTIQDQMLDQLKKFPETWLERKPGAIAIHFRGLLPLAATCFRFEMANILSAAEGLKFQVVSEAIEVTPTDGWDKGTAVLSILTHMQDALASHPLAVYFGDAANDAEGMAVTTNNGGVSVGIGPYAPLIAEQHLTDSSELVACLDELTVQLAKRRGLLDPGTDDDLRPGIERTEVGDEPVFAHIAGTDVVGVLLLDPDARSRRELAEGMAAFGWRVWQANTPEQATELLTEHADRIRVVLVDLQLPGLQGARTLAKLGENYPDLIRCFMSADIRPYTATAFSRLSDRMLFTKPFHAAEVDAKLRELLQKNPHLVG